VTLLLVPVLYSIFVLDLKLIKWEVKESSATTAGGDASKEASLAVGSN
jgi:hypothetical protein